MFLWNRFRSLVQLFYELDFLINKFSFNWSLFLFLLFKVIMYQHLILVHWERIFNLISKYSFSLVHFRIKLGQLEKQIFVILLFLQSFKIVVLLIVIHLFLIKSLQFKLLFNISKFSLLLLFLELDLIM